MTCPFAKFASFLPSAAAGATTTSSSSFHAVHGYHSKPPANKVSLTLSEALRVGTAASHRAVEKSRGVSLLLHSFSTPSSSSEDERLHFDRVDYTRFNIMLACIYAVLEASLHSARCSPLLSPLFGDVGLMQSLARTKALLSDVEAHLETVRLHTGASLADLAEAAREDSTASTSSTVAEDVEDPSLRNRLLALVQQASPSALLLTPQHEEEAVKEINEDHIALLKPAQVRATLTYVSALLALLTPSSNDKAGLLLSHAYTRYLGDLSGGQHIVRKVVKRFPLDPSLLSPTKEDSTGFEFYNFTSIASTKGEGDLKTRFRNAMESALLTSPSPSSTTPLIQSLVAEANTAFILNTALFESLLPAHLRMDASELVISPTVAVKEELAQVAIKGKERASERPVVLEAIVTVLLLVGVVVALLGKTQLADALTSLAG